MNAHVFVDAENVSPDVTFRVVEFFGKEHTITRVDIVAKEEALNYKYRDLDPKLFRVQNCYYGKNSADTWICIEIVRAIIDEPELELIIILSSDRDFLPVIKFAADYEKKIFVVSDGVGHKSWTAHLKTLGVDPKAVELKDFRCGFDELSQRLSKFLPLMNYESQKFFFRHADEIKFILVRKANGKMVEMPFVDGMSLEVFRQILRELKVLGSKRTVYQFAVQNFLKVDDGKVRFMTEEEIMPPVTEIESVDKFLSRRAADVRNIFIKHGEKIFEIPFVDAMPLELFGRLLREKKIIGKSFAPSKVAAKSLLDVRDNKVYLRDEDGLETFCDTLEDNVDSFFAEHITEIKKIFVAHGQKHFEIPFVDGMPLETFGKLLRVQKIIGPTVQPSKVAAKSLLAVRRGKVYLRDEDDLENFCAEQSKDIDQYFIDHAAEIRTVAIKHGKKKLSFPFVDGMPLERFCEMLRRRGISTNTATVKNLVKQSFLDVRDEKVFLSDDTERIFDLDGYLNEHALQLRTLKIRRGGEIFSIPFVNGMPLGIFGQLLHEQKIISGFTSPVTVAKENSLVVRDEKIFYNEVEQ